jgi:ABC-type iron transport system FetAB permease component
MTKADRIGLPWGVAGIVVLFVSVLLAFLSFDWDSWPMPIVVIWIFTMIAGGFCGSYHLIIKSIEKSIEAEKDKREYLGKRQQ